MKWIKSGLIYTPVSGLSWVVSHAALPTIEVEGDRARVYFSPRDASNRARIASFELDLSGAPKLVDGSTRLVLDLGPRGAFDESGATVSCVVVAGARRYLYYTGWTLGVSVPFYLFAGLAISEDAGGTWQRASEGPLLDRSAVDPLLTASPWVLLQEGRFRMWYVSGSRWEHGEPQPKHYYNIRYAESEDGIRWSRGGIVCIDYATPEEHAFSRPCVVRDADAYRMWYGYRGQAYRVGYAESRDGVAWTRQDARAGIDVSPKGWDSGMVAYPCVFDHGGERYMLYNGNDYGRTGIGLARLDRSAGDGA